MVVPVQGLVPVQSRRAQQPEPRFGFRGPCTGTRARVPVSVEIPPRDLELDLRILVTILCQRHVDWILETWTMLASHLCSFAHACEGRSLQAGTPELAYATYVRSCGIEKPTGSSGTDTFQE
uniref:Uncharacterized protein n=1 Tax=Ananas comosus var. bracteatus TaxID=296719 RepID=A0A6V7PE49_ANACO|nr:unnamed protein product [Ananas comosus var. bracteatus]